MLPPHGSNDPANELWYRRRAMQTLWNALTMTERQRVLALNAWSAAKRTGVYVHAKVQTYDDCLIVCGSANMNRRSFSCDMELDCAVLHKPSVQSHLANLAHMPGPAVDELRLRLARSGTGTYITTTRNVKQTTILDPFFCPYAQIQPAAPNGVPYAPGGILPDLIMEPTPFSTDIEAVDASQFRDAGGATGRLDFLVWLLERYTNKGTFPYRDAKLL